MNILDKVIEANKILDEIDEYDKQLSDLLSTVDSKLCDLYHTIENNKLKTNQCYRIVQEIHKLRLERRKIKNDMGLMAVYNNNRNKLVNYDFRKILLNNLGKENKKLLNSNYNNRKYSEEEIKDLIGE